MLRVSHCEPRPFDDESAANDAMSKLFSCYSKTFILYNESGYLSKQENGVTGLLTILMILYLAFEQSSSFPSNPEFSYLVGGRVSSKHQRVGVMRLLSHNGHVPAHRTALASVTWARWIREMIASIMAGRPERCLSCVRSTPSLRKYQILTDPGLF